MHTPETTLSSHLEYPETYKTTRGTTLYHVVIAGKDYYMDSDNSSLYQPHSKIEGNARKIFGVSLIPEPLDEVGARAIGEVIQKAKASIVKAAPIQTVTHSAYKGFEVLTGASYYHLVLEGPVQPAREATQQLEADKGDIEKLRGLSGVNHVIGREADNELILICRGEISMDTIYEILGRMRVRTFEKLKKNPFKSVPESQTTSSPE